MSTDKGHPVDNDILAPCDLLEKIIRNPLKLKRSDIGQPNHEAKIGSL